MKQFDNGSIHMTEEDMDNYTLKENLNNILEKVNDYDDFAKQICGMRK
jgi:hypothetical protein